MASLQPDVKVGTGDISMVGGNPAVDKIPSQENKNRVKLDHRLKS